MTEAMPFLQKTILLSYDPRPFKQVPLRKSMLFGFVFLFRSFRFLIQPTSSVSLISFVEQPGECVDQCRLSALDHTSIDLQFLCGFSNR